MILSSTGRLAVAIAVAAAVVLTGPLIGGVRSWLRSSLTGDYRLVINVAMALAVTAGLAVAIRRIRQARAARYAAIVAAVGVAVVFAYLTRSGNPDVDAVERFHFVEYAAVTWLFSRAWIHHRDLSTLALPVLATFIAGVGDEAFQWFVPGRVGEWRDLGINLAAIASGLLFSLALDPPGALRWRVLPASRRATGLTMAAAALVIAGFLHLVHAGVIVRDVEVGDFTSRYTEEELLALARDRHELWRTEPPPMTLQRYSREDQYRSEGVLRIRRRNACWALNGRTAWRENVILEKFYGPVLDTPAWDTPEASRWPPEQRLDLARRIGTVPLRGPCNPEVPEPWLFLWSPRWLWIGAGVVAALALWMARVKPGGLSTVDTEGNGEGIGVFDPAVQDLRIERLTQRRAWPRLRFTVAVTAADPATWGGSWRRVRAVRPDVAGQYVISELPAGTYLLAALTDEWKDAAFLAQLVPASIELALAKGETKTQNLRLGK